MAKDIKFLIGAFLVSIVIIIGVAFLLSKNSQSQAEIPSGDISGLTVSPERYELGDVAINGGIVIKDYEVTNSTSGKLALKKMATSCMCTTASIQIGDKTTKFFGMEGHGDANPPVNLEIGAGETAKVTVKFDPAAHGPQGVGPFDRIVWLYFSEGTKELTFNGVVTGQ